MFGYINIDKPNTLIKDYAEYRAYYCGLCKTLGKQYSQLARFSINYDITFLSLIAHNYLNCKPIIKEERCVVHPIGKKFPIVQNDEIQEKIADVNIILGYFKANDDVADGGFKYKLARFFLKKRFKKAAKELPNLALEIKKNYSLQAEYEKAFQKGEESMNLDKLSVPSMQMMKAVSKEVVGDLDENLENLSLNLGKWIYVIDAVDDLEKDLLKNRFNPLISNIDRANLAKNKDGEMELGEELRKKILETAEFCLKTAIFEIRMCYDKMDISISEGAISNVIYMGLRAKTDQVLKKFGKNLALPKA